MNGQLRAFGLIRHAGAARRCYAKSSIFFNRDVMFGNDCFQLNDKHIDDALQWHNIAQKGWDVCSP